MSHDGEYRLYGGEVDGDGPWYDPGQVFTHEVQSHQERYQKIVRFTSSSTKAAGIMLAAAVASLVIANTGCYDAFLSALHADAGFFIGGFAGSMSIGHAVNDILMAVFFLLVGLEIKYEMTVGELTDVRAALLPAAGAIGGVFAPVAVYLAFNAPVPESAAGWGVPTATDIAFALGIVALLGSRVPTGAKVFLSTLAVFDDIIAILVIAVFYGQSPSLAWLVAAAVVYGALIALNRRHVYALAPYIVLGVLLWSCVYASGVHATISGVLLALAIPVGSRVHLDTYLSWSRDRVDEARVLYDSGAHVMAQPEYLKTLKNLSRVTSQAIPPAVRLEHALYPWVYFLVLPLFALTNADVRLVDADVLATIANPVFAGVFFGLLVGKPAGIMAAVAIAVKAGLAPLPKGVTWANMLGISIVAGVGFTMAIFVSSLAFADAALLASAKLAILCASLVSGIAGFLVLAATSKG